MQKNTKKILAAIVSAFVVAAVACGYLAVLPLAAAAEDAGQAPVIVVMTIYALIMLALIGGVAAALYQRLKEIRGGEEELAKQY